MTKIKIEQNYTKNHENANADGTDTDVGASVVSNMEANASSCTDQQVYNATDEPDDANQELTRSHAELMNSIP